MRYIVTNRFKGQAICGAVNLPYGTVCEAQGDYMFLEDGRCLCLVTSQNAYDHFSRDDDGNGKERGRLVQGIIKTLSKSDKHHQDRWDKIWEDRLCQKYKLANFEDYWLWNYEFYNADIQDLQYIAMLVGMKGVS